MTEDKNEFTEKHVSEGKDTERAIRARRKEPFSERMASLVQMCGSASELARLAGVSESAVRKWKAGESEPTVDRLVRLARATGVDVGWLATGEGESAGVAEEFAAYDAGSAGGGLSPEVVEVVVSRVERWIKDNCRPDDPPLSPKKKAQIVRTLAEDVQERGADAVDQVVDRFMPLVDFPKRYF